MSIIEKFKGFDMIKDTLFLKDFNKENPNLKKLEDILKTISDTKTKKLIEKDISLIKWGLEGENNVYFELKNSFLPMICLHDIRIQVGDLSAQIDFLVLTNKFFYIFETKHLVGDIRINDEGDFIRVTRDEDGNKKEEGMYNPVTQGNRHARILKKFLENKNILTISDFPIKSIAVLANPKTILDKENAPGYIKDNIYRYDQIVHFLQNEFHNNSYEIMISDSKLDFIGCEILKNHNPIEYDYKSKYKLEDLKATDTHKDFNFINNCDIILDYKDSQDKIKSELKNLRKIKAKEYSLKAYELFNNKQLDLLIKYMPKTLIELNYLSIIPKNGSYLIGNDIIEIINKYSINKINKMPQKNNSYTSNIYLKKALKEYRYNKSKKLSIEEYRIFTNNQLDELLNIRPKKISDLNKITGFKSYHINTYGKEILNIINKKSEE